MRRIIDELFALSKLELRHRRQRIVCRSGAPLERVRGECVYLTAGRHQMTLSVA